MNRLCRLLLVLCPLLVSRSAQAQVTSNSRMPPVVAMTRQGWDVTMQNGNLTLGFPVTVIPGEVPIPVNLGMNGTYIASWSSGRYWDPVDQAFYMYKTEIDRPVAGAVHFGYISTSATLNRTTLQGLTVLEDGTQIPDSDWTAFNTHTNLGTTLNLPQAYGFSAVGTGVAKVDPTGTYLSYSTTAAGLGSTYQSIVQGLPLTDFGAGSANFKVVIDKNKARVYGYATSVNTWVPVLWADRFGHYVKFQWARATSNLPAGVSAVSSVTATNQRSKGVVLRWAEYTYVANQPEVDILRVDYLGIIAPSVFIRGYAGPASLAPSGFVDTIAPLDQYTVVPSIIGAVCRPTLIQVGASEAIVQPSWNGSSGPTKSVAPSPMIVGDPAPAVTQNWTFSYDANHAELASYTDPGGLTTSFTYSTYSTYYTYVRGVSQVNAVDASSNKRTMRWTRTFPSGSTPLSVKLEGWWDPDKMPSNPDRYHQIVFPTDSLTYGNGVYQTDTLKDIAGTTWSTTTYAYNSVGAGLNAGLSSVQSVTIEKAGESTVTIVYGYPDSSNLQVTQQNVSVKDASGAVRQVSTTTNTYGTRWDMLEGHQLIRVATTRYSPNGAALPPVVQTNVYDNPVSGPALLQLQKNYLDAGTVGQHGSAYAYDSEGRPYIQSVYHVEGSSTQSSPNYLALAYDPTAGVLSSQSLTNTLVTPYQYLTTTLGGFDSAGRATISTDASGITTTYAHDDRGRILSISRPGTPVVTYTYPDELTLKETKNGLTTTTSHDGFGRVTQVTIPTGINSGGGTTYTTQTPTYDLYSRQVSLRETNPAGTVRSQSWGYDALDRVVSQAPYIGGATTTSYAVSDINSKVTTILSNQISTSILKDPFGQIVEIDSPDGSTTKAIFDGMGNQISLIIQPATGTPQYRAWFFDTLGRLTSKNEPETNLQTYGGFNAMNQPTTVTEGSGTGDDRTRTLSYDGFGRMLSLANGPDSLVNSYTGSNLTTATRTVGGTVVSQSFVYNGAGGRLSSESTSQPGLTSTIGYTYDATGFLTSLNYPSGRVVGYGFDALGRVNSITNNGVPLVNVIKFDDWGNRWQTQFASGAQDQWDADLTGTRLKTWNIGYVGGGPDGRGYTYDDATNILNTAGEWTLTHDSLGRVTEADGFGIKTAHIYDAFGNAISHTAISNGSPVPPAFNNFVFNPMVNNQIPGLESNGALTGWNTNGRGEATQVGTATSSGTILGLAWDGLGLVKSVNWNAGNQSYLYNPLGMRVSLADTVTSTNNRKYAYATGGLLLTEYESLWRREVVYLGSQAIAEIDANGVHELHSDHLGSPRLITKGSGAWASYLIGTVDGTQAYGPYGELISQTTGNYVPLTGYTGHIQTDASGLIYMRGRYYSPAWHAFVNSDQGADPNTWNQRAYVGGSPFLRTDPSGMTWLQDWLSKWFGSGGSRSPTIWGELVDRSAITQSSFWLAMTDPWFLAPIGRGSDLSGGTPKTPNKVTNEDCNWIKKTLAMEASKGTGYAARNGAPTPANMNPNSDNGLGAFPTALGGMDVSWFKWLSKVPQLPGSPGVRLLTYVGAKSYWNAATGLGKLIDGYPSNYSWEIPGLPAGEAAAAMAAAGNARFSDLFNPSWMKENCP